MKSTQTIGHTACLGLLAPMEVWGPWADAGLPGYIFLPGWLMVPVYTNTVFRFLQLVFVLILFRIFKIAMVMGIVVCRQIYQTKCIQN